MSESRLEAARRLHGEGRIAEALAQYSTLLAEQPEDAALWHLRALAEHQLGRPDQARQSAERSIALDAAPPAHHLIAGYAATELGDSTGAIGHFRAAIERKPDWVTAWIALGLAYVEEGEFATAKEVLEKAVALDPGAARAWNSLGVAQLALDERAQARASFGRALEAMPGFALAHLNLAKLAEREGKTDEALENLESALRSNPRLADALLIRAQLLRRRRDPRTGGAYKVAVEALPNEPRLRAAWADFLTEAGHTQEAIREFRQAEALAPRNFRAALGARLTLPAIYEDLRDVQAWRERYASGLEELHEGVDRFTGLRPNEALASASWINFFLAYQGRNDRELQSRFGDLLGKVLRPSLPHCFEPRPRRRREGRLRVGFFSNFFFNCTVGRYFTSWIADLDPAQFEKVVFYPNEWVANATKEIASAADRFHHLSGFPLHAVARCIAEEDLDVLVYPELGMHAPTFAIAALRLAPVQVAGWGHPTTTGLASIDAFLSCADMEPEDAQDAYRERLLLLPGIGTRYRRPGGASTKSREELGLPARGTLYLCPQSLFKIHPDNDELFARVLAADPQGRIVFFDHRTEPVKLQFRRRLMQSLERAGIDGERRTVFLGFLPHADYLRVNSLCDVMLDTVHWSGGNTSLDAIAAGLPMVTLPGGLMRGRQSAAMLRRLGLDSLIARDVSDYADLATRLGRDGDWRREVRSVLAERANLLFDDSGPTRELARILEELASGGA